MGACELKFILDAVEDALYRIPLLQPSYRALSQTRTAALQRRCLESHGPVTTVSVGRARVSLDLREMHDYLAWTQFTAGRKYESGLVSLLETILSSGKVFVDVGANNGYFTLLASSLVGETGHVYAFEPGPRAYARLLENLHHHLPHPNVDARQLAVSDRVGTQELFLSAFEDGLDSLVARTDRSLRVAASTLDAELGDRRPDVVKIDVEGSELSVLRGMSGTLRRCPDLVVIVEWNRWYATADLWSFLRDHFHLYRICEHSEDGHVWPVARLRDLRGIGNVLCVPHSFEPRRVGFGFLTRHAGRPEVSKA